MSITEWFLIQAPVLQCALIIKAWLALFILFVVHYPPEKRWGRWSTWLLIYGLVAGTLAPLIPGEEEAGQIRILLDK